MPCTLSSSHPAMPGYVGAKPVDESTVKLAMKCLHCNNLMKDPVQTEKGVRVCKSCAKDISEMPNSTCEQCNTMVILDKCYQDRAAARPILAVYLFCLYVDLGCSWQGQLCNWELHCAACVYKGVPCPYSGCTELVARSQLEEHKLRCCFRLFSCSYCSSQFPNYLMHQHHGNECQEMVVRCEYNECAQEMKRKEMREHKLNSCLIRECLVCRHKVHRDTAMELHDSSNRADKNTVVHLSQPKLVFDHLQTLANEFLDHTESLTDIKLTLTKYDKDILEGRESDAKLQTGFQEFGEKINLLETQLRDMQHKLLPSNAIERNIGVGVEEMRKELKERDVIIRTQKQQLAEMKTFCENLQTTCDRNTQAIAQFGQRKYDSDIPMSAKGNEARYKQGIHGNSCVDSALESRLLQLERRVEDVAGQSSSTRAHVQELELQLQASLASTYNGAFLWRIPNIARRRRDAVEERITSIYSPPFYSGRSGYKMCIRAYLNGDGQGYSTHLSLFFVIMQGEFDGLLKWPFEHKVSLILVDQNHRKHIVQTFKPTPESSSFQLPHSEMNVASGCPQFAKLDIFDDSSYCKDDTIFIKCITDTTKIFHP